MELDIIIPYKISQTQKDKYHTILSIPNKLIEINFKVGLSQGKLVEGGSLKEEGGVCGGSKCDQSMLYVFMKIE
jgi:hypothetical protein